MNEWHGPHNASRLCISIMRLDYAFRLSQFQAGAMPQPSRFTATHTHVLHKTALRLAAIDISGQGSKHGV